MKWLLAIITALTLVGCTSSSATAGELANDVMTGSVETHRTVITEQDEVAALLFKSEKYQTWIEGQIAHRKELTKNRIKLDKVVKILKSRVGRTPYVFSGSSLYGWDCSGMVRWAYEQLGVELEHSATKQAHSGHRVKKPKVGDIVVFGYKGYKSYYHSAIYIGNGKVVNANRGYKGTYIQPLTDYKGSRIVFIRILDTP